MKVLHVISGLTTGGAERFLEKLVPELRRLGIDSEIACLGPTGAVAERLRAAGFTVHFLGFRKTLLLPFRFAKWIALVKRVGPDVIQGWMHPGNLMATLGGFWARPTPRGRVRVFWSVHQSLYSLQYESAGIAAVIRLNARLSSRPRGIVYVSNTSQLQHEAIGFDPVRSTVIRIGFDTGVFHPLEGPAKREARERLGLDPHALWFGLVARDEPKKDPVNFVRAAARVAREYPEARFLMLGKGMADPGTLAAREARRLGIESSFRFEGETQNPETWISSLDVLVSASFTEAFPAGVGEAMACGVPCVVTDVGDSAALLGGGGTVVPPRDPESLAAAMQALLRLPPEERFRIGAIGRARILDQFSLQTVVLQYAALYRDC